MDESEKRKKLIDNLYEWMKNDEAAVQFILHLNYIVELWDDLIDGDQERTADDVNKAFRFALVDLIRNPFYQVHFNQLNPLIMAGILAWHDSNELAKGDEHDRHMAYMLKQNLSRVYNHCAYLIGGEEWARKIGPDLCRAFEEKLDDYMKETEQSCPLDS